MYSLGLYIVKIIASFNSNSYKLATENDALTNETKWL